MKEGEHHQDCLSTAQSRPERGAGGVTPSSPNLPQKSGRCVCDRCMFLFLAGGRGGGAAFVVVIDTEIQGRIREETRGNPYKVKSEVKASLCSEIFNPAV